MSFHRRHGWDQALQSTKRCACTLHHQPVLNCRRVLASDFIGIQASAEWIATWSHLEPLGAKDTLGLSPSRIRGSKFEQWQSKRRSDLKLWRQLSLFVIRLCQTLGTFWHSTCGEMHKDHKGPAEVHRCSGLFAILRVFLRFSEMCL